MDAVTYIKTINKICDEYVCDECPIEQECNNERKSPEAMAEAVEKWLAEHPPVTYASKMREVFPDFSPRKSCLAAALQKCCGEICPGGKYECDKCWNREYGSLEVGHA